MSEPTRIGWWELVHDDGSICEDLYGAEDYAEAVAGYYDSNAGTGRPMACGPHRVQAARTVAEGTP